MTRKEAAETLGVHYHTLYAMVKRGELEYIMIGNHKMFNVEKFLKKQNVNEFDTRLKICYCRVSSNKQKDDLKRQISVMKKKFPEYIMISDIGSGLNDNRKGYKKIIDHAIKGEIEILVVAYKDRLVRFGYDLIEWIIKEYSNGQIIVLNKREEETPTEELSKDLISIMNVYVAKVNGLRKYKKHIVDELEK